ncbi:MAG: DMT family transporter [Halodesulfurarchaeum sp.]
MSLNSLLSGPRGTLAMFLLLGLLWGSSFVAIEIGLHVFPPLYFAGFRYLLAGMVLFAIAMLSAPTFMPRNRADVASIAVVAVFLVFGNHAFLYLGEQFVSGAIAAIIISLSPVLTVLFASLTLDRGMPRGHEVVGFVFGLIGVIVVAQPDPSNLDSSHLMGIGLVFLAATSFAAGGVLSRLVRSDLPMRTVQGWAMLGGAGLLLVGAAIRGESMAGVAVSTTAWASLGYLVVFSGILAFLLYFTLLDRVGPSQLNLVSYLEPIAAAAVSWAVIGQVITPMTAFGFVLVMVGFTAIRRDLVVRILEAPYARVVHVLGEVLDSIHRHTPSKKFPTGNGKNR